MPLGLAKSMRITAETGDIRVGVTSRGESPLSEVCEQFGRSYWLLIYNPVKCQWYAIDNGFNRVRSNGAGVAAAEIMIDAGVRVVLTGETGPKAFRTLSNAGISIVHNVSGVVEEALCEWMSGRLSLAFLANDSGSPNCLMGRYMAHWRN